MQYGAGISKVIDCNKSIVGRVIGKGGETIKTMQKHFGANIQIDQQTEPMKITVSGQPAAVEAAAAAVQEIVNGGNPYLGGPAGPQGYGGGAPLCSRLGTNPFWSGSFRQFCLNFVWPF